MQGNKNLDMAILKLNSTNVITESNNVATIDNNVVFPAGHILQVQSKNETVIRNTSSTSFVEIHTDFFAELTTLGNNSKILVQGTLNLAASNVGLRMGAVMYRSIAGAAYAVTDFRADTGGSRARALFGSVTGGNLDQVLNVGFSFVDSPAQNVGTVLRYKPYWFCESSGYYVYLNRNARDIDDFSHARSVSNVVITEIAQ